MKFIGMIKLNGKNVKKYMTWAAIVFFIGILIFLAADIFSNIFGKPKPTSRDVEQTSSKNVEVLAPTSYEDKIKRDLIDILSQIKGVGKVNVMVYFEGSSESQPAYNVNENNRVIQEKDSQGGTRTTNENNKSINVVMVNEGTAQKPFILKQVNPSIGGVIVVAEGAEDPHIKEMIKNAVKTVLNLPANKVTVEPMKK
ncbi:stage III sporulation protein AG [Thermobrachium celere]|uniref:stage III sporulation protein AG n=1 Tax=Thermobrachium celere TaxID=53422 RepID=UPI0019445DCD|nr:stage III sporulation protein AG [Thermobrachium celere]GFR34263.1 stage III sporulation protein AG [Thermobrachium celere]